MNKEKRKAVFLSSGRNANYPSVCDKCGGKYKYKAQGRYECEYCRKVMLDDYGKVRTYLEENGSASAIVISSETGVPVRVIHDYLAEGKLEIPNGSHVYIKCERCKTDIRYGRFCSECVGLLSDDLRGTLHLGHIGEVPRRERLEGKMWYLDKDKKIRQEN